MIKLIQVGNGKADPLWVYKPSKHHNIITLH